KTAAFFMAAVIAWSSGISASARGSETAADAADLLGTYLNETLPRKLNGKSVDIPAEVCDYVGRTLPYYLSANGLYGSYDFFEPIRIRNWDDDGEVFEKYLIAVSKDGTVSGFMTATYSENRLTAGFRSVSAAEMSEVLFSGAAVQIGYKNGFLLLFDGERFTVIEGPDSADTDFLKNFSVDEEMSESLETVGTVHSAKRTNTKVFEALDIKTVQNDRGASRALLCWAACIACMGMQNSLETVYTAKSLYEMCDVFGALIRLGGKEICTNTSRLHSDEPHGCEQWERFAFFLVGINAETSGSLTARQVSDLLGRNKPIMIAARKTESPKSTGHTVVLYRYEEISDSCGLYTFMDPGMGSSNCAAVTVLIERSVMEEGDNFILPSTTGTYINWYQSFYAAD
ncbi:MAG: hypothetical protein K2N29_05960, partial [Ruminiclostridium sp.]|nr:hypothetical protein [Ruminiclostridium sp.]